MIRCNRRTQSRYHKCTKRSLVQVPLPSATITPLPQSLRSPPRPPPRPHPQTAPPSAHLHPRLPPICTNLQFVRAAMTWSSSPIPSVLLRPTHLLPPTYGTPHGDRQHHSASPVQTTCPEMMFASKRKTPSSSVSLICKRRPLQLPFPTPLLH